MNTRTHQIVARFANEIQMWDTLSEEFRSPYGWDQEGSQITPAELESELALAKAYLADSIYRNNVEVLTTEIEDDA